MPAAPGKTEGYNPSDVQLYLMGQLAIPGSRTEEPTGEYGMKRYVDEAKRLYGVLDKQLAGNAFAAGAEYTIADMSIFPWAARHEWHTVNLADFPNVKRWYEIVNARPAVTKGMAVPYLN